MKQMPHKEGATFADSLKRVDGHYFLQETFIGSTIFWERPLD
jgi:hypothetical protein